MEIIIRGTSLKDKSGERIDFPKNGKPYFDQGLRRTFHSPQEKKDFMDKHGLISDGSMPISPGQKSNIIKNIREETREKLKKEGRKV